MTLNKEELRKAIQDYAIDFHNSYKPGTMSNSIKYPVPDLDKLVELILTRESEIEKSYGGCHNCYGRGYATFNHVTIGYDDFDGERFKKEQHEMRFCDCERGKQIKELVNLVYFTHPTTKGDE